MEEQAALEKKNDCEIVEDSVVPAALEEYAEEKDKEEIQEKAKEGGASKGDELQMNSDNDEKLTKSNEVPIPPAHGQVGLPLSPPKMQSNRVSQQTLRS